MRYTSCAAAMVLMLASGSLASAQDAPNIYKDLPGVRPQDSLVGTGAGSTDDCETEMDTTRRIYSRGDGILRGTDIPVNVYRCQRSGVTIESRRSAFGNVGPDGRPASGWPWGR